MFLLAKYGVQTTFQHPLIVRGAVDLAGQADFTAATGDVLISKDGGTAVNSTNLPSCPVFPDKHWQMTLTGLELTAGTVVVQIVDTTSPKAVEDQFLLIYTYGNALAKIPFDLSLSIQPTNTVQVLGTTLKLAGAGGQLIGT